MLPDLACVALDEKPAEVVVHIDGENGLEVNRVLERVALGVLVEGWWAWILLVAADAANGLVVLVNLILVADIGHVEQFRLGLLFSVFVLAAGASPAKGAYIVGAGCSRRRVLGRLGRERATAGGLLGGTRFDECSRRPFRTPRRARS